MMTDDYAPHPIIAIEGPIGAGKSTLCRWLRRFQGASVADEAQSSLLPSYFRDPARYAFAVQVDSLTQRYQLLKASQELREIIPIWLDRSIFGDFAFARANHAVGHLDAQEFRLYKTLYDTLLDSVEPPEAVLWLDVPVEICAQRVEKRGTAGEVVPMDYATALISAYKEILLDVESRGTYVHRVDWSNDLSKKGLYHAQADTLVSQLNIAIEKHRA